MASNRVALLRLGNDHRVGNDSSNHDWRAMDSAPRDGMIVELKCSYGVAPWYAICRWTDERYALDMGTGALVRLEPDGFSWRKVGSSGGPSDERYLQWRPYDGQSQSYVDPTGGAQDTAEYWRGAVAGKHGLPLDYFEDEARKNSRKNGPQTAQSFWRRLISFFN